MFEHPKRLITRQETSRLDVKQIIEWCFEWRVRARKHGAARSSVHKDIEKKVLDTRASEVRRSAISDARNEARSLALALDHK